MLLSHKNSTKYILTYRLWEKCIVGVTQDECARVLWRSEALALTWFPAQESDENQIATSEFFSAKKTQAENSNLDGPQGFYGDELKWKMTYLVYRWISPVYLDEKISWGLLKLTGYVAGSIF